MKLAEEMPKKAEGQSPSQLRASRLKLARANGTHTKAEWLALLTEFDGRCVRCGTRKDITKDHIIPVCMGHLSSDSIENIQPVCSYCNTGKHRGGMDEGYNWKEHRRTKGWDYLVPRVTCRGRKIDDRSSENLLYNVVFTFPEFKIEVERYAFFRLALRNGEHGGECFTLLKSNLSKYRSAKQQN